MTPHLRTGPPGPPGPPFPDVSFWTFVGFGFSFWAFVVTAIALVVMLASCISATPIAWDRPNVTESELSMDKAKCELAAETANPDRAGTLLGLRQGRVQHSRDLCMQSRGYQARTQ